MRSEQSVGNSEWSTVPLRELTDPERETTYGIVQPGKHVEGGVQFIRVSNIRHGTISTNDLKRVSPDVAANYERSKLRGGELLLTLVGTVGESAIVPEELAGANVARAVAVIPFRRMADAQWVHYALQTDEVQDFIDSRCNTTVQTTFNLDDVKKLPVPLPPREQRDTILDVLAGLDDKIHLNRKMNRTLEAMARAIFKSWFVDFDPVRTKMEGEQPTGVDLDTTDLFPDRLVDSELGEIPEGWEVQPVKEIINVTPRRKLSKGDVAPYLKMAHAPEEGHYPHDFYDREFNGSGSKFKNGDTLMAKITPCLENGKTAFVDFLPDDDTVGWGSTEYLVLRSRDPYPLEYSYYLARSRRLRRKAIKSMSGTSGRQRVSVRGFRKFKIVVPPPEVAQRFGELARDFMTKIRANNEESTVLAQIRDQLIPSLLGSQQETSVDRLDFH